MWRQFILLGLIVSRGLILTVSFKIEKPTCVSASAEIEVLKLKWSTSLYDRSDQDERVMFECTIFPSFCLQHQWNNIGYFILKMSMLFVRMTRCEIVRAALALRFFWTSCVYPNRNDISVATLAINILKTKKHYETLAFKCDYILYIQNLISTVSQIASADALAIRPHQMFVVVFLLKIEIHTRASTDAHIHIEHTPHFDSTILQVFYSIQYRGHLMLVWLY